MLISTCRVRSASVCWRRYRARNLSSRPSGVTCPTLPFWGAESHTVFWARMPTGHTGIFRSYLIAAYGVVDFIAHGRPSARPSAVVHRSIVGKGSIFDARNALVECLAVAHHRKDNPGESVRDADHGHLVPAFGAHAGKERM